MNEFVNEYLFYLDFSILESTSLTHEISLAHSERMLAMLEIGIYSELAIGNNKRRQHGHSPQNSIRSSGRKDREVSDYTEHYERGKHDILIQS